MSAGEISLVVREDSSGTTEIFRNALSAFDDKFRNQVGPGSNNTQDQISILY